MGNPYRDHADRIQALIKRVSREHQYDILVNPELAKSAAYQLNFVVAESNETYEDDLQTQLDELMEEVTDGDAT